MARKSLVVLSLSLLLLLPMAAKADGYEWTGAYVGINAGVAVGKAHTDVTVPYAGAGYFAPSSTQSINGIGERTVHDVGATGGGQLGFDYQWSVLVAGLETDFQALDLSEADRVARDYPCCAPGGYRIENHIDTDWLYTLRGKLGVAVGRVLVFGSGGLAVTNLQERFNFMDDYTAREEGKIHEIKPGWVAGGGIEFAFMDHFSVRAEYLHFEIERESQRENSFSQTCCGPYPATDMKHSVDLQSELGRIAVNYRF
jgi:outer membrane immunogenic protein